MDIPTPDQIMKMSDEELMQIIRTNGRPGWGLPQQAIDEMQYRFVQRMGISTSNILASSEQLTGLTAEMTQATRDVHREVGILATSSEKLETLTEDLKTFTIWLMIFAGIQIAIVGVQTWKMFQPEKPIQVVVQPPPPTAPQTPVPPPR
jgi:hypothetical protein